MLGALPVRGRHARRPLLVGLSGLQGSGKSTFARALAAAANARAIPCDVLSLDDFYYGRRARQHFARTRHPLFATRGVPGTHDVGLLLHALAALGVEARSLGRTRIARRCELGRRLADRSLHVGERFEIAAQAVDAADSRALEIPVVRKHARDCGDIVLLQQEFQFLVAAKRIGRAQQRGERIALRLQQGHEIGAPRIEA